MGYLLKEALEFLCSTNQWSYAVFWKLGSQNPTLLIWEECYYQMMSPCAVYQHHKTNKSSSGVSGLLGSQEAPVQAADRLHSLIDTMMMNNQVNLVGDGVIGRAAFTGNHLWFLSTDYVSAPHPPEVINEVKQQFSAGMQTVAVIPVLPLGIVQFGSSSAIVENMKFVNDVRSLIHQLGCIPGALLSASLSFDDLTLRAVAVTGLELLGSSIVSEAFMSAVNSDEAAEISQDASGIKVSTCIPLECLQYNSQATGTMFQANDLNQTSMKTNHYQNHLDNQSVISSLPVSNQSRSSSACKDQWNFIDNAETESSRHTTAGQPLVSGSLLRANAQRPLPTSSSPECFQDLSSWNGFSLPQPMITGNFSSRFEDKRASSTLLECSGASSNIIASQMKVYHMHPQGGAAQTESTSKTEQRESKSDQAVQVSVIPHDHGVQISSNRLLTHGTLGDGVEGCQLGATSLNAAYDDLHFLASSGNDLFDILGEDLKSKQLNERHWTGLTEAGPQCLGVPASYQKPSDISTVVEDFTDNGCLNRSMSCHLLDDVVSNSRLAVKHSSDDSLSCMTTAAKMNDCCASSIRPTSVSDQVSEEFTCALEPNTTRVAGQDCNKFSYSRDDNGNCPRNSHVSQISSWIEQDGTVKPDDSVSTAYSKKYISKPSGKRLKLGEGPRPRPKDRQMIQDRLKELREIIPDGAKCSIDALLELTIKHMLFLQSVNRHAEKLKQSGEAKICEEGGLQLESASFGGGATWAFEVSSRVCPVIVEDLSLPRQMYIEVVCEGEGLLLEVADLVRGLGLAILKGMIESSEDKLWARFLVEADRDVTRMEVFIWLTHLLEQLASKE